MASPAVRSLLRKSKLPLPLLISGTTLTSPHSKANVGTAWLPNEVVPPPQSSVFLRKASEMLLGGGKAWASGRIGVVNGSEDGLRLGGRRPAVKDEEVDEDDWVDDDDDDDDDDLKDLDDSEDFDDDDDEDDFEDEEEVPLRKRK